MSNDAPPSASSQGDPKKEPSEREKHYVGRIEHEHSLLNNRLTWLLFSQTIFFGIYANLLSRERLTAQQDLLADYIAKLALITCLLVYISILGAVGAMIGFQNESNTPKIAGHWFTVILGLVAPIFVPLILILAWLFVLRNL